MTDRASRSELKRNLRREAQRLLHHIDHLSDTEFRCLDGIVADLEQFHVNDTACRKACTVAGRKWVPWGTRHASWLERTWLSAFADQQRR